MNDPKPATILAATTTIASQMENSKTIVGGVEIPVLEATDTGCARAPSPNDASATGESTPLPTTAAPSASPTSPANSLEAWVPLTKFVYFPKLPFELRTMIFKIAIKDSAPRILAIQPQYREHPALIHVNGEARDICTKYYHYCASKQRTKLFRFFIDYEKDVLYLNHPFSLLGGRCQLSPLQQTNSIYPEYLESVETLAMNMKEVRNLTGPHRGENTLWTMLDKWCPNLKELRIVVNNFPTNGLILKFLPIISKEDLDNMIPKSKKAAINELAGNFKKVRTEKGILKGLKMRLVLIDEGARKVKTKKEKQKIEYAWKKANEKVNGVSEVERLVAAVEEGAGAGTSGKVGRNGAQKVKKPAFEKCLVPDKAKKAGGCKSGGGKHFKPGKGPKGAFGQGMGRK